MKSIQFLRLQLQKRITGDYYNNKNVSNNISAKRKPKKFVTVQHTLIIEQMNNACPHCIAKANDIIMGYALVMKTKFKDSIKP
jgi:hypothetical protein